MHLLDLSTQLVLQLLRTLKHLTELLLLLCERDLLLQQPLPLPGHLFQLGRQLAQLVLVPLLNCRGLIDQSRQSAGPTTSSICGGKIDVLTALPFLPINTGIAAIILW